MEKKLKFEELRIGVSYPFSVWTREAHVKSRLHTIRGRVLAIHKRYALVEIATPGGKSYKECIQRFDAENFNISCDSARFSGRRDKRTNLRSLREKEGLSLDILASFLTGSKTSPEERVQYLKWCEQEPRSGIHEETYRKAISRARRFRQYTNQDYEELLTFYMSLDKMTEQESKPTFVDSSVAEGRGNLIPLFLHPVDETDLL